MSSLLENVKASVSGSAADTDVLIAGAGPTGLMLALWLAKSGVRVRIADPKSGPVKETRAIGVQARTLEFYDQLGIGQEALAQGEPLGAINLFVRGHWRGVVNVGRMGEGLTPHPYLYSLTQDKNEELLVAHLADAGIKVDWQTEVTDFTQDEAGVTATLKRPEHEETLRASYLAGCDGAGSLVRHTLGISMSGDTYAHRFYVADVILSGKVRDTDANMELEDGNFLVFFPLPGAGHHRVIGQLSPQMPDEVDFETVRPEIETSGVASVEQVNWFSTYRIHHRVADTFRAGRAFILGDAGHVHTPVGGQGMNTGLGDAVNLAWKLAQAVRGQPEALATYEPERRPFALSLVNTTDRVFTGIVASSPLARLARLKLAPIIVALAGGSTMIRRLLFLTVSQTRLHYPYSPLSVGRVGKVRGGMRLPWVKFKEGDNFAALRSLSWQMHVYGTPTPELLTWCGQHELPLHVFPFNSQAARAGLMQDAIYLIRPDGYVGLAHLTLEAAALSAYAQRWGCSANQMMSNQFTLNENGAHLVS